MTLETVPNTCKNGVSEFEASFMSRYSTPHEPDYVNQPITYEFTNDPALLHQYYRIREIMYRKVHGLTHFSSGEDHYDKISRILIAKKGKVCIGGCRFTVREPDEYFSLPLETERFLLRKECPELQLSDFRHCEISRFSILDEFNSHEVYYEMSKMVFDSVRKLGIKWVFIKSPHAMARNWRKMCHAVGVVKADIRNVEELTDPEYPEINWKLLVVEPPYHPEDVSHIAPSRLKWLRQKRNTADA